MFVGSLHEGIHRGKKETPMVVISPVIRKRLQENSRIIQYSHQYRIWGYVLRIPA